MERALGQQAVQDLAQLRQIERELQRQGYLEQAGDGLQLSPRALRRLGATALRRVFATLQNTRRGDHDVRDAGAAGEFTGASREWRFGDEQPLDVVRTVRNAVLRTGGGQPGQPVRLRAEDFEVIETERRSSAAVALLVDMSYSMELRGTWGEAKTTALALHALVSTKYPQDAIQIIGFSDYARVMTPRDLVNHDWERVYGTNLQHALMLARRHLDTHRTAEPVILVITDGEPTAHLTEDGYSDFCWPPSAETVAATLAEVERCTRRGATINIFMLDDEQRLVDFMHEIGRRNGGRVFLPGSGALGEYVVSDYLQSRPAGAGPADPGRRHGDGPADHRRAITMSVSDRGPRPGASVPVRGPRPGTSADQRAFLAGARLVAALVAGAFFAATLRAGAAALAAAFLAGAAALVAFAAVVLAAVVAFFTGVAALVAAFLAGAAALVAAALVALALVAVAFAAGALVAAFLAGAAAFAAAAFFTGVTLASLRRPAMISLNSVPGRKAGTEVFFTRTFAPVAGFRPMRAARSRRSKAPKPVRMTFSPFDTFVYTSSRIASRIAAVDL